VSAQPTDEGLREPVGSKLAASAAMGTLKTQKSAEDSLPAELPRFQRLNPGGAGAQSAEVDTGSAAELRVEPMSRASSSRSD
jgi:hypothetical protein